MTYATLKSDVESAMGRDDIPDYVYRLATADINRDIRSLDMEATTTLTVSSEFTSLPSDFLSPITAYVDDDVRAPLQNMSANAANNFRGDAGEPRGFAIVSGQFKVLPTPDGSYSVFLRYTAKLDDFSADSDTNDILTRYPDLYQYGALRHAAVWAQDSEMASTYSAAYQDGVQRVNKLEQSRRYAGTMRLRTSINMARK